MKLILASASQTRRAMLVAAGVPFQAVSPVTDERAIEDALGDVAPLVVAATLAQRKALAVPGGASTLVLGCDQVLETADGDVLSKAGTIAALRAQLVQLRGTHHRLISAAEIAEDGDIVWRASETATLHMRAFSDDFLDAYLAQEGKAALACVGGYRIEGFGAQLFDAIDGSHFAIMGLPLLPLLAYLRERGVVAA